MSDSKQNKQCTAYDKSLDADYISDRHMDHSINDMISIIMNMKELIECMREVIIDE